MGAARLRDLVLVVRKLQVDAAAVDVEAFAQQRVAHGRALDMPAGPPPAPRAVPAGLVVARRLPQHEIHRVALVGRHLDPRARDHVLDRPARERARIPRHRNARRTGHAPPPHRRGRRRSASSIIATISGMKSVARGSLNCRIVAVIDAERRHVLVEPLVVVRVSSSISTAALGGAVDDLVLHVGDVAHIGDVVGPVDMRNSR
jgi:hypothetical protein